MANPMEMLLGLKDGASHEHSSLMEEGINSGQK